MTDKFFADEHDEHQSESNRAGGRQGETHESPETGLGDAEPSESAPRSRDDARMIAVMSYIPFLCFIPLLNMKQDRHAQFHARQGVILFLIEIVAVLLLIDQVSDFVFRAVLLVAVAFSIAGIYFGLQGRNNKLPIIGDLAEKTDL